MNESRNRTSRLAPRAGRLGLLMYIAPAVLSVSAVSSAEPKHDGAPRAAAASEPVRTPQAVTDGASNPWFLCGSLSQLSSCSLTSFPTDLYEYGFKYNSTEALVASCLLWNVGFRFMNRVPYITFSDNPTDGSMRFGGTMFYTGTNAADDDVPGQCPAGFWRQRYWALGADNSIQTTFSNGCVNLDIYCRLR